MDVPLGRDDNVATFQLAPGYMKYHAFCAEAGIEGNEDEDNLIIADPNIISDGEDGESEPEHAQLTRIQDEVRTLTNKADWTPSPDQTEFDFTPQTQPLEDTPNIVEDEEDLQPHNHTAELLREHH